MLSSVFRAALIMSGILCFCPVTCAYPESLDRGNPTLTGFFCSLMKGGSIHDTTKLAYQRNAIKWHFAGVPMMARH